MTLKMSTKTNFISNMYFSMFPYSVKYFKINNISLIIKKIYLNIYFSFNGLILDLFRAASLDQCNPI